MNRSIFRAYDIRGIADEDLDDNTVENIGKAYGTLMQGKEVVIGMDNRKSSPRIKAALIKGLLSTGCKITDIGTTITPIFYFARYYYNIEGGIMITASHNPAQFNGFKVCKGKHTMFGEDIQNLANIAEANQFIQGPGSIEEKDVFQEYLEMLKQKIQLKKKFKIVIDCGNGTASLFAQKAFENWDCEVIPLYCDSNPDFPNHQPDPVKEKNMIDLIAKVKETNADLGVGFDGDGDRIGAVDNKGNIRWGDELLVLFFREMLAKNPGEKCIIEVKCSQSLVDDAKAHTGKIIFYKTGHSLIKDKMLKENALLTGEMSGHMFFRDEFYGADDAFYATGRLLRILDNTDKTFVELFDDVPKYYATPELRPYCSDEKKFEIVKELVPYFKEKYDVIDVDGARVLFDNGWGLIRVSNTQPALIVRCEGRTPKDLEEIKDIIFSKLKEYPEVDFEKEE
jgi:phosphomannomutase / phosphoglucomutase